MKKERIIILVLVVIIILAMIYGINWTKRFFEIDSCLDKGGRWNYELNECEESNDFRTDTISKYFWHTEFDSINNIEFLQKGELVDSIVNVPIDLIEILNKRVSKSKIEIIKFVGDTIRIKILNDEFLTEEMGTTWAYCFLGETVYSLTEIESIDFVRIEMNLNCSLTYQNKYKSVKLF